MRAVKTLFLLTALTVLLVLGGDAIAGQQGMTFGLIIAVVMNGVAYFFSDKIALRSSGAQPVTREQLPRLYEVMERLVAKAQLPMPKLYVIPQPAPNAFATGRNPSHASVAVTAGLMELMNDDELEGVIAHELSHVRNYDILITSIAATLAGAITWIASMGRWAMIFGGFGGSRNNDRERWRIGGAVDADRRADRRADHPTRNFPAARVFRRCVRRQDGRAPLRSGQRARKAGRLQQANPHGCFPGDGLSVHRCALERGPGVFGFVQYTSAALGANRGPAQHDGHALNHYAASS